MTRVKAYTWFVSITATIRESSPKQLVFNLEHQRTRMSFPEPFYRWRPHPWHGLPVGLDPPTLVTAFIEITPFDLVKYEIDKTTGYLKVDRPQMTSSMPPSLYGIIPRTYCGPQVGALMKGAEKGDGDPLDICVISERPITKPECIMDARVIGGIPMIDGGLADDKIIAVLNNDQIWSSTEDVSQLPKALVDRLLHYFSTYKLETGQLETMEKRQVTIDYPYGREHAAEVIKASMVDYDELYGADT